jgi:hypothetical protein
MGSRVKRRGSDEEREKENKGEKEEKQSLH